MFKLKLAILPLALGLVVLVPDLVRADVRPRSTPITMRSISPVYGQVKLIGRVQSVQGVTIVMALDNGTSRSVALPDAAGGDFQFLVGQRIVLTEVICVPPIGPPAALTQARKPDAVPQKW